MKKRFILATLMIAAVYTGSFFVSNKRVGPIYYYPPAGVTGSTNPAVTQATIQQTICVIGWTATIRPSSGYTTALKKLQERQYGLATSTGEEEDHYISLELGGHPTDPANLWPQFYPIARLKDVAEGSLKRAVCAGQMTLKQAQNMITGDWYAYYEKIQNTPTFGSVGSDDPDDTLI